MNRATTASYRGWNEDEVGVGCSRGGIVEIRGRPFLHSTVWGMITGTQWTRTGPNARREYMRQLIVFNNQTLDGYFSGTNGDIGWSHRAQNDPEWKKFTEDNAKGDGTLLFGRITYDLMASYWPTPAALKNDPAVAERINNLKKVVLSRTL